MEGETAWERSARSHAHEMSPESVEKRAFRHVEKSPNSAEKRGCSVEFGRNGEGSVVQCVVKSCSTASGGGGLSEMVWGRLLEAQLKDMEESIRLVCRSSSPPGHTYAYAYAVCACRCLGYGGECGSLPRLHHCVPPYLLHTHLLRILLLERAHPTPGCMLTDADGC